MSDEWTAADDAVEEVRAIRRQLWAEFDDDPGKLIAHLMELDKQYADRMLKAPEQEKKGKSAA